MSLPPALPGGESLAATPAGGSSSLVLDEGQEDGITLDMSIEQLLRSNLDVLALGYEIPQADADYPHRRFRH